MPPAANKKITTPSSSILQKRLIVEVLVVIVTSWLLSGVYQWRQRESGGTVGEKNVGRTTWLRKARNQFWKRDGLCYFYDPQGAPSCDKFLNNESMSVEEAEYAGWWHPKDVLSDVEIISALHERSFYANCFRPFARLDPADERDFPLAFAFKVHDRLGQFVEMLQQIYRHEDVYCLTYDTSAKKEVRLAVEALAEHLPNVVLSHQHVDVHWGHLTELEATMNCLRTLNNLGNHRWRYVQQMMADDLPLKTNREMAAALYQLQGASDISYVPVTEDHYDWRHKHSFVHQSHFPLAHIPFRLLGPNNQNVRRTFGGDYFYFPNKTKPLMPDITLLRSVHTVLSREFTAFVLSADSEVAQIYNWLKDTLIPVEHFFATVYYNVRQSPGADPEKKLAEEDQIARYQIWRWDRRLPRPCQGKIEHYSCVFGVFDLPTLTTTKELIVHKVRLNVQPAARHCLRQWHYRKSISQP